MSSGNPHGLSEISHFGSFQRVGGKAGGFINKKFFHPSSIKNQEKLWKAQTQDERDNRKQMEMEKRREEERQVEAMRKQLYLAGQGKASDMFVRSSADDASPAEEAASSGKSEQKTLAEEQKKRVAQLKRAAEDAEADGEIPANRGRGERALAKSRYPEDKCIGGHTAVWGSWFSAEEKRWGFGCCKVLEHAAECPLPPPEGSPDADAKEQGRGKRRRQGEASPTADDASPQGSGAQAGSSSEQSPATRKVTDADLIDPKLFEAAARRKEQKRLEELRREEAKKSAYLNNLLHNPAGSPEEDKH